MKACRGCGATFDTPQQAHTHGCENSAAMSRMAVEDEIKRLSAITEPTQATRELLAALAQALAAENK